MKTDCILQGDCLEVLKSLPDNSIDCCVTSPPYYGLRDYGHDGQIGMEMTPQEYIDKLVRVFHEVRRALREDGTLWLNIGDSYCNSNGYARASAQFQRKGRNNAPANDRDLTALHNSGFKTKDLMGIPWMLAFALRNDGWYLRQDIIWAKPNPMPESVRDRCTKSHEYIFLLSKSEKYYFDSESIKEDATTHEHRPPGVKRERVYGYQSKRNLHPEAYLATAAKPSGTKGNENYQPNGKRNKRDVWNISTHPHKEAHFAVFPEKLVEPCILAGSKIGGVVLDPFFGSGTTGVVALQRQRHFVGIELNPDYVEIARDRLCNIQIAFT